MSRTRWRWRWWWIATPLLLSLVPLLDRPRALRPLHRAEWLEAGDTRVRAVRAGVGDTTLLLLHGFAESLFTWRAILDPLAWSYRVMAVDLPGFGGSEKPDVPYTLDAMTDRLSLFLDRWTRGPVVVVGQSMGGALAAALALRRPDRVVALVLIAPAGAGVGLGGLMHSMNPSKASALAWYLAHRSFILPDHDPDWLWEPEPEASYDLMRDPAYRKALVRVLDEFDFRGLSGRFKDLRQPTLLIWGTLDPVIPYALAQPLSQTIPCARLVTLSAAFHRPQAEVPDTVLAAIRGFLANPKCGS